VLRRGSLWGELLAEFLGTFVLIMFGVGVVAQVVMTPFNSGTISIHWGWGIGVVLGVYVAGGITGAHINPAVTLAVALRRGFPWSKVLPYWIAQTAGAFVAALLVFWNYLDNFNAFDPGRTPKSQVVFNTFPGNASPEMPPISHLDAFRDQIIGTALLTLLVFALIDTRNIAPLSNLAPFIIGLVVFGIGLAWGALAGYAINPARDLGPRLVAAIFGWQHPFADQNGAFYAWVPIVGPLIGGPLGAYVYDLLINPFTPAPEPEPGRVPPPEHRS